MSTFIQILAWVCNIPTLYFLNALCVFGFYISGKSSAFLGSMSISLMFIMPIAIGIVFLLQTLSGPENPQTDDEKILKARIEYAKAYGKTMFRLSTIILMFSCYSMLLIPLVVNPANKINVWLPMTLVFIFGLYAPWAHYTFGVEKPVYSPPPILKVTPSWIGD